MDPAEQAVRAHVERLGVPYAIVPCDPALADTAAFCEAYGYSPDESANTIVVVGKASFADAERTQAITGMQIGGVTAIGLPPELPIWVDSRVMERERIILGGGSRSCKVVGPPALLSALANVEVVEGLAVESG